MDDYGHLIANAKASAGVERWTQLYFIILKLLIQSKQ